MYSRKDAPRELTWDLSSIYSSEEAFTSDEKRLEQLTGEIEKNFKGKIKDCASVQACLDEYRKFNELVARVFNYRDLPAYMDFTDSALQEANSSLQLKISGLQARLSFIDAQISVLSDEEIQKGIDMHNENSCYLKEILRKKAHRLSDESEHLLAKLQPTFEAPQKIYNASKFSDLKFSDFKVNGKSYPLGYSLFEDDYEFNEDEDVRHAAFSAFSENISRYKDTTAAVYYAQVQSEKILSEAKGFDSVFDYLLFMQNVTRDIYDCQLDTMMEYLAPVMQKYAKELQKAHKLEKMTFADLKLPLDPGFVKTVTIPEAHDYIKKGLAVLGSDYGEMIDEAFKNRWIDFAANEGKSTGGFCASPYGCKSYILLNWHGKMRDVFVLAHELGHAGHFKLCNEAQSVFDTDVSPYYVESPSTMNEILLGHSLLKESNEPRFRRWVLSNLVGVTYFHNCVTHFIEAYYQREVYRLVDKGESLSAEKLSFLMRQTLEKFWGGAVEINPGAELTWMRQPHYYMGLYPYTYSAGLTVATMAEKRIREEGQTAVDDWKDALTAGGTLSPKEFAARAGVDITSADAYKGAIKIIGEMVDEISELSNCR